MKSCPACNRTYTDETLVFCLIDGSSLSAPYDPHETLRIPAAPTTNPPLTEAPMQKAQSSDSKLLPHPTMPSPQPPLNSVGPRYPAEVKPRHSSGPALLIGVALGVLLIVGIGGVMWLGKDKTADNSEATKVSNTNASVTNTPHRNSNASSGINMSVEYDTDRPGADYKEFDLPQARFELCRDACAADVGCKAYTYVKPGVQGPNARCWLKPNAPATLPSDCCISGVKP